ncbi:MAG: hypothetical protein M1840_004084 [Geoglossum simile]|nr:MAG: hypothetical protein M1840_004084 [Geoglossum simile]
MSMFRAKRLDIGGFINVRVIRDHTKRKVFEQHETERYFIDDKDEVKSITNPEEDFNYKITKNVRYNELRKEAFNTCLRNNVLERLAGIGMETIRLPFGAEESKPHVPILASRELQKRSRVLIVFGSTREDLGIWCYRRLGSNGCSISAGSAISLVKRLRSYHSSEAEAPGIIIANPGQLLWHRKGKRVVTFNTWSSMPRKSAVSKEYRIDGTNNRIPYNQDPERHVQYIFDKVVRSLVSEGAGLDILATAGGMEVLRYLEDNWATWKDRINAIALTQPFHWADGILDEDFRHFLKNRGSAYVVSDKPIGQLLHEPQYGCAVYSSGETVYGEAIPSTAYGVILDFFHAVAMDPNIVNPETLVLGSVGDQHVQEGSTSSRGQGTKGLHGRRGSVASVPTTKDANAENEEQEGC